MPVPPKNYFSINQTFFFLDYFPNYCFWVHTDNSYNLLAEEQQWQPVFPLVTFISRWYVVIFIELTVECTRWKTALKCRLLWWNIKQKAGASLKFLICTDTDSKCNSFKRRSRKTNLNVVFIELFQMQPDLAPKGFFRSQWRYCLFSYNVWRTFLLITMNLLV